MMKTESPTVTRVNRDEFDAILKRIIATKPRSQKEMAGQAKHCRKKKIKKTDK
jgi:hypothetical protein